MESFCLITVGKKITLVNSTSDKPYLLNFQFKLSWNVVVTNQGPNKSLDENISSVLGKKVLNNLGDFNYGFPDYK